MRKRILFSLFVFIFIIFCIFIYIGAVLKVEVAWSIGDVFNGMMAFTNLIGVLGLAGIAVASVKNYLNHIDRQKNPLHYQIR